MNIVKWGNGAAIRLPATLLAQLGVGIGDAFEVAVAPGALTLRPVKPRANRCPDAAIEAMKFALKPGTAEGMVFLDCWMHGDFATIRKEWPDAPAAVFAGAEVDPPPQKTEAQARKEFAAYFSDLKESMTRDGAKVSKEDEWDRCIAQWITEGEVPPAAAGWKCPRSIAAELAK